MARVHGGATYRLKFQFGSFGKMGVDEITLLEYSNTLACYEMIMRISFDPKQLRLALSGLLYDVPDKDRC